METAAEDGVSYRSHGFKKKTALWPDDEKLHNVEKLAIILGTEGEDWQRIPLRIVTIRCAFPWPMVWIP